VSAGRLETTRGDITGERVDAIVNAANEDLLPGGGVCGAIHRAAGPDLARWCAEAAPCPTGDARATPGGSLPARHVIHAVGPVWRGGGAGEDQALASCHVRALEVAADLGCRSVAFPAISTGIYGFPAERAAPIAVRALRGALGRLPGIELVRLVLFSADLERIYAGAVAEPG